MNLVFINLRVVISDLPVTHPKSVVSDYKKQQMASSRVSYIYIF